MVKITKSVSLTFFNMTLLTLDVLNYLLVGLETGGTPIRLLDLRRSFTAQTYLSEDAG